MDGMLRGMMDKSYFLVPGYGAQGGGALGVKPCFNDDGLGAVVSSSRGVLYHHLQAADFDHSRTMYLEIVKGQAKQMQQSVYSALKNALKNCFWN